jgi:hypothetical protein
VTRLILAFFVLLSVPVASEATVLVRRIVAGCGSSEFANDTFTDGTVNLDAHTKDSGGSWTNSNGLNLTNGLQIDGPNDVIRSTASASNGAAAVIDDTVTCYDYKVVMDARTGSTGTNRIGPLARFDLTTGDGYWLRTSGSGSVSLYILDGGSATTELCTATISSLLGSFSTSTMYTLRLEVDGSSLGAYINDTEVCTTTDTTYTAGKPGVKTTNTSPRGDNFVATYLP